MMTDERVDALLRHMDVAFEPDPAFLEVTLAVLRPKAQAARVEDLSRLGRLRRDLRPVLSRGSAAAPSAYRWALPRATVLRAASGFGISLAAVALVLAVVTLRLGQVDRPSGALPAPIAESGVIRIGVTSGAPQLVGSGQLQGFDVDVAREIGRRLGLGVQVTAATPDELLATGRSRWDAVLVELPPGLDQGSMLAGTPYMWRAGAVVTPASASVARIGDLGGRTVCVVLGGDAAAWLDGTLPVGAAAEPAPAVVKTTAPTLDDCLAKVSDGSASAAVADWVYDTLALPAGLVAVPVTPFAVPAAPRVAAGAPDGQALLDAVDSAIEAMRADGTLANLSRHRFGGLDLTARP